MLMYLSYWNVFKFRVSLLFKSDFNFLMQMNGILHKQPSQTLGKGIFMYRYIKKKVVPHLQVSEANNGTNEIYMGRVTEHRASTGQ